MHPYKTIFMVLWVLLSLFNTDNRPSAAKRKEQQRYEGSAKNGEMAEMSFERTGGEGKRSGTSAHATAQAVKASLSDTKCAIGPAIEMDFIMIFELIEGLIPPRNEKSVTLHGPIEARCFYAGRTGDGKSRVL